MDAPKVVGGTTLALILVSMIAGVTMSTVEAHRREAEAQRHRAFQALQDSADQARVDAARRQADSIVTIGTATAAQALPESTLRSVVENASITVRSDSAFQRFTSELSHRDSTRRAETERREAIAAAAMAAANAKARLQSVLVMAKGTTTVEGHGCRKASAARVQTLLTRHPAWSDDVVAAIACGFIQRGMTAEQVRASWGAPEDVNRTVGSWGVHEQWVYSAMYGPYVYLEDGVVTSWQN